MTDDSFWVELFFYLNLNIPKKSNLCNVAGLCIAVL